MVQLVLRCSEDTTCHSCVEKAGESFCKTKELEELRALPEGSAEWVEAKARLDAAVQAAVTAGQSIACIASSLPEYVPVSNLFRVSVSGCAQAELLEARAREAEVWGCGLDA